MIVAQPGSAPLQLTLEQRLLRFLVREERDEQRTNRELRAQPHAQITPEIRRELVSAKARGEASEDVVMH